MNSDPLNNSSANHTNGTAAPKPEIVSPQARMLTEKRQEFGVVYIMYMRFAMRHEGLDAFRAVFAKARKEKWTPWIVFEAAGECCYLC